MAKQSPQPETPLDEALQSALRAQKFANFFYDTYLNSVLYTPVKKEGASGGSWTEMGIQDRFFPLYLAFERGRAVPQFDSLERLQAWSQTETFDYLKVKAHVLLKILDPSMAIVINAGTSFEYVLTSEILDLLRQSIRPVSPV